MYLCKIREINVFQSVTGYECEMVPAPVKGVLCLVGSNLLRVHSLSVQARNTVWVSPHMLALPKQDMAKMMGGDTRFLPAWVEVYK